MDSTFINTKDAIFELLILIRGPIKKGARTGAPFFSPLVPVWLFFRWEKKVKGLLGGWLCCEADDKIDDQAAKNKDPLHRTHA